LGSDLTKLANAGKMSPGPIYQYDDQVKYQKVKYYLNFL